MSNHEQPVYVIGAGGHALVVLGMLRELNYSITGILDDQKLIGTMLLGAKILGPTSLLRSLPQGRAVIAIGNNSARKQISQSYTTDWLTLVHPTSYVATSVKLGAGTIVCAGAAIIEGVEIASHCIINTNASVDHECKVADYAHVACGATLAGNVYIGEGALIGVGAKVIPQRKVGAWSTVAAGATVIRDVADGKTVMGTPAVVRQREVQ